MTGSTASWDLPETPEAPRLARRLTADALSGWGASGLASRAQLLVSELVTNAVLHAQSRCQVELQLEPSSLWIGVRDFGGGRPAMREPDPSGGRGLHIVDRLSGRWLVDDDSTGGKVVWCELSR